MKFESTMMFNTRPKLRPMMDTEATSNVIYCSGERDIGAPEDS